MMKVFKLPRYTATITKQLGLLFGIFLISIWWVIVPLGQHSIPPGFPLHVQDAWTKISDVPKEVVGPFNASKLALMVESRPLPRLVPLILHTMAVVPPDWRFLFIGSSKSVYSVGKSKAIQFHKNSGKLELMKVPEPWKLESPEDESRLLTDARIYEEVLPDVEWILKFGHDGILCANSAVSLDEWLPWSWAGALRKAHGDRLSDTGGLSLRRASAVRRILSFQRRRNNSEPEDVWFRKRIAALPGEKVASNFHGIISADHVFPRELMGYHVTAWNTWPDRGARTNRNMKQILEYCPELSMILDMSLDEGDIPATAVRERKKPSVEAKTKHDGIYVVKDDDKVKSKGLIYPPQPAPLPLLHSE
ncbi:hypothetical protein H634G_07125 [Metarhizium anisopliae BRIP 53293]|uniref:DUF5672 domain-containing protein n=1 Tax=Metarhizium anisopliae BRIP 53293 TaxID=1291518 RepID=A0A0D9NU59_METAN|nr:hypothetical protein H634G_07125 [Metarhizium anisopliae BRIP 53293]KJK86395.1 hypothetical protein H633G_09753 [Metarhizium anisopliae BRIP 53284]